MAVEPAEPLGVAAAAAMTLCGHRPMTLVLGHVWITIWRPYRTRSPADFLAALPVNGIQPGNWGRAARIFFPGHILCLAPASGVFPQFTGNLCTQALHSSSRRGWRDRSVLSRRPRQPSRAAVAAPLRDPYDLDYSHLVQRLLAIPPHPGSIEWDPRLA